MRAAMIPSLIVLEPFGECLLIGVVMSWSVSAVYSVDMILLFITHCLLWFIGDYILVGTVEVLQ